ncbi:MAG: hypothetical protein AAFQ64_06515 [Pseudomonadota bacterium]
MPNDTKRGIGAVMIAMGAIGLMLWLVVARLDPDTARSLGGLFVATLLGGMVIGGIHLSR